MHDEELLKYVDSIKDGIKKRTEEICRIKREQEEVKKQEQVKKIIAFTQSKCRQAFDEIVYNLIDWNPIYIFLPSSKVIFKFNILGESTLFITYESGNIFLSGCRNRGYFCLEFIDNMLIQAVKDSQEIKEKGMLYD